MYGGYNEGSRGGGVAGNYKDEKSGLWLKLRNRVHLGQIDQGITRVLALYNQLIVSTFMKYLIAVVKETVLNCTM